MLKIGPFVFFDSNMKPQCCVIESSYIRDRVADIKVIPSLPYRCTSRSKRHPSLFKFNFMNLVPGKFRPLLLHDGKSLSLCARLNLASATAWGECPIRHKTATPHIPTYTSLMYPDFANMPAFARGSVLVQRSSFCSRREEKVEKERG